MIIISYQTLTQGAGAAQCQGGQEPHNNNETLTQSTADKRAEMLGWVAGT